MPHNPEHNPFEGLAEVLAGGDETTSTQATQAALETATGSAPSRPPWWPEFIEWPPVIPQVDRFGRPTGVTSFDTAKYDEVFSLASSGRLGPDLQVRAQEFGGQAGPETVRDPNTGQTFFRTQGGGFQPFSPPSPEEAILTLNQQIDKALSEGDFQYASALAAIQDRPTSQDVFDRALAFAKSPGDQFIISQIQRNLASVPRTPGEVSRLPKNSYLTQAFLDLTKDPFQSARLMSPQARPTPVLDQVQGKQPTGGEVQPSFPSMEEQRVADRNLENQDILSQLGQTTRQTFESQIGDQPVFPRREEVAPTPTPPADGQPRISQPPVQGLEFQSPEQQLNLLRSGQLGTTPRQSLFLEDVFAQQGINTGGTVSDLLGGNLDLGAGLQEALAGGAPSRPQPLAPALGLRLIPAQTFQNLSPIERAQYQAIAQLAGIEPAQLEEEQRSITPGGSNLSVRRR